MTSGDVAARFEFATAGRVIFGAGAAVSIGSLVAATGRHALLVHGGDPARAMPVAQSLEEHGVAWTPFGVRGEPGLDTVRAGRVVAGDAGCDTVVACGGGSVLDAGKAIAAMLTNDGDVLDYLEVVGKGQPLLRAPLPVFALPTTAGTGSEVTRNAVLSVPERRVKVSMRSPLMLPTVALVDPLLTLGVPPPETAATGLDALTQLIEPFTSSRAQPMTDALCREAIPRAAHALPRAWSTGNDVSARTEMALVSLFGGMALANAGLGAAHGFAAPLGGMFAAPHGALCARLLPAVMAVNIRALQARCPDCAALDRYNELGVLLTGKASSRASDAVRFLVDLCGHLEIPPLSAWGVTPADVPSLVEMGAQASSMKANPISLERDELAEILQRCL